MLEALDFLLSKGARSVSCGAVHGVLTGDAAQKLTQSVMQEIVVCDTIPVEAKKTPKMKVLSVTNLFAEAISRIHSGQSVSCLFR